jgi:hypothetical protein
VTEPTRRVVRRVVTTTRTARKSATVELTATRAIRLGIKLVFAGLRGKVRRRPVRLALKTRPATTQQVDDSAIASDFVADPDDDAPGGLAKG